jgi:methylthioribose-1-phosphate isomerase
LLDVGEAAVINLAREQGVTTVLMDERKARKAPDRVQVGIGERTVYDGGGVAARFSQSQAPGREQARAEGKPMNVTVGGRTRSYRTVDFDERRNAVRLIEQRLLPHRFQVVATKDFHETARAIRDMVVRGAGAIGATAAYGLAQGARAFRGRNLERFTAHVERVRQTLASARPTAVDPLNAMNEVRRRMGAGATVAERQALALDAARAFADEDVAHCEAIGRHGAPLIRDGTRVLTHCNAGWLAFVDVGSATAPLYAAQTLGRQFHVCCDETRPRCQGASLTAWELAQQGIPHAVIADNAAGHLMQRGEIDLVIVGSDRVLTRLRVKKANSYQLNHYAGID